MNIETKKFLKFIFLIFIIFVIVNVFFSINCFAESDSFWSRVDEVKRGDETFSLADTFGKLLWASIQIGVSAFFIIKFTVLGIQYFSSAAASEKANLKKQAVFTLIYAVLAYLGIFLFTYAVSL